MGRQQQQRAGQLMLASNGCDSPVMQRQNRLCINVSHHHKLLAVFGMLCGRLAEVEQQEADSPSHQRAYAAGKVVRRSTSYEAAGCTCALKL
jgi:hypothetical protein